MSDKCLVAGKISSELFNLLRTVRTGGVEEENEYSVDGKTIKLDSTSREKRKM